MKIVVKFGGSSLASAKQFKKVADIIRADKARRYVVPSAPGKRNDKDEKVTDLLYQCYDAASQGKSYKKILDKIRDRYEEIIDGLHLNVNLDHEFQTIEENFVAGLGREYAASRGEYLNGILMANYLGIPFIDAAEVLRLRKGRKDPHLFQRRFRYHRFHCSPGHPRRSLRELDGRVRIPGGGSQNRG